MSGVYTLVSFAHFLTSQVLTLKQHNYNSLHKASNALKEQMVDYIGTYDYAPPRLKPATIARKATGDSPLLETGELRDSIQANNDTTGAMVGSDNPKAQWHVLGTVTIPPRDFMTAAAIAREDEIIEILGDLSSWYLTAGA